MKREHYFAPGSIEQHRRPRLALRQVLRRWLPAAGLLAALLLVLFSDVVAAQLAIWGQGL